METMNWSWLGLLALGAFHGVNPGMGWLFAVALGMQERRRAAVWRAMLPLALGHALAYCRGRRRGDAAGAVVPLRAMQWAVGGVLLALGVSRFFRHGHPRWVGMQVGVRDLTVWSFLMASAHGAGLMVLPLVWVGIATPHCHVTHAAHAAPGRPRGHRSSTAPAISRQRRDRVVVFEKLGVGLLRKAWLNLDLVWAVALVVTSVATLVMANNGNEEECGM